MAALQGAAEEAALTYRELTMMEVRDVLRRLVAGPDRHTTTVAGTKFTAFQNSA